MFLFKANFKMYDVATWRYKAIDILSYISGSKDNKTMKFGQLIEYSERNFFFKNHAKLRQGDKSQAFFYFLKKANMR